MLSINTNISSIVITPLLLGEGKGEVIKLTTLSCPYRTSSPGGGRILSLIGRTSYEERVRGQFLKEAHYD